MLTRRVFLSALAPAAITPVLRTPVLADDFPSRPVTMIVPYPPGGPTDAVGRTGSREFTIALPCSLDAAAVGEGVDIHVFVSRASESGLGDAGVVPVMSLVSSSSV